MARKQSHYMVDFFYPEAGQVVGFRKESCGIVAYNDSEAIKESKIAGLGARPRIGGLSAKPAFFRVRKVFRKSEEIIYDSSKMSPHA